MAVGRSLIQRVLILFVLVGVNGGLFGNQDSSTLGQEDPVATQFINIMKKQLKRESSNKQHKNNGQLPGNLYTNKLVRNFVFRKFKGEMVFMFSYLPEKRRCHFLVELSQTTKCNLTAIMDILSNESILKKPLNCFSKGRIKYSHCGEKDSATVLDGVWNQTVRLFNNVSAPFQCNIINRISTTSSRYRRQKQHANNKTPRITLQLAEKQLKIIFPFLNIKEKCSKVWKPLKKLVPLQSPASLLNLTVKLHPGVKRKAWLRFLKKKAYQIYKVYYDQFYQSKRQRPLIPKNRVPSNPPILDDNNVKLKIVRVTKANGTISVVFGIDVRKPRTYFYSKISPVKKIITALRQMKPSVINSFFNATVVALGGTRQESGKEKYYWSMPQIIKLRQQFPQYLVAYYRNLDRLGRCLVMLYISSSHQRNLRTVEMIYSTFKYVPRKFFCSSKRRNSFKPLPNRNIIYINNLKTKKPRLMTTLIPETVQPKITNKNRIPVAIKPKVTNTSKEVRDFPEQSEEEPDEERITPLEIGLFAILAFLCIAIFAFTINCILFAIKKKSPQPIQANTAFERAIFKKENISTQNEDQQQVKVILLTGEEPNTPRNATRCNHQSNTPPLNTSTQCPKQVEVTLSRNEISIQSDGKSLDLLNKDQTSEEDSLTEKKQLSNERIDSLEGSNNCSETNSQSNIHDSRNSISSSSTEMNSTESEQNQRTLKECSGELKVISDDDKDHVRSARCNSENGTGIRNSTKKLFVLLDQSNDRETIM